MGLGDRIAVMIHGQVRQVGHPVEVYDDPADTFVATFIGSPPMNLVPRDDILVGFRPEHLLPVEARDGRAAGGELDVDRIEYLSGDRHVYGTVTGLGEPTRVIARLPATVNDADRRGRAARVRRAARAAAVLRRRRPGCAREPGPARGAGELTPTAAGRGARRRLADREGALAWLFLPPTVVYIVALVAVPFGLAIALRFSDVTIRRPVVRLRRAARTSSGSSTTRCSGGRCATRSCSPRSRWSSSWCSARSWRTS